MRPRSEVVELYKDAEYQGSVREFQKFGIVMARTAIEGEVVITMINGVEETRKTAGPNDMVVRNPGQEEYIISSDKFRQRYTLNQDMYPGLVWVQYKAIGRCWAFMYTGDAFEFEAPWGEAMKVEPGDMIAITDPKNLDDIYRIEKTAFAETYRLA